MGENRRDIYQSPLVGGYSSIEMQRIFGDGFKFGTWRKIWLAYASISSRGFGSKSKSLPFDLGGMGLSLEIVSNRSKQLIGM